MQNNAKLVAGGIFQMFWNNVENHKLFLWIDFRLAIGGIYVGWMLKFKMLFYEYLKECCHSQMLYVNRFQISNSEYFLRSDFR